MNRVFRNLEDFEVLYPDVIGANVEDDIIFTNRAMEEIIELFKQLEEEYNKKYLLRLRASSTINKAKYLALMAEEEINNDDKVFELHKITVVIDRKSIFYFMGIVIDYVEQGEDKGFIFIDSSDEDIELPSQMPEENSSNNQENQEAKE